MWAEASKPVIVYCVSRKPSGSTYHQNMSWLKPELLMRSVKTELKLAWLSGTKMRIPMITATPARCHHTEMPLNTRDEVAAADVDEDVQPEDQREQHERLPQPVEASPKFSPRTLTS